jgi:WD40 repeat protein/CHASE3 domain sensor protein
MGVIFISHSSKDNEQAIRVRDWLKEYGWGEVFIDLDPEDGLAPGQRWKDELRKAGERCSAIFVLLSPNWAASEQCRAEFLFADYLGKLIFPVIIAPTSFDALPDELKAKFQIADISTPEIERDGFARLKIALDRAGLTPGVFPWPPEGDPHRSPYRGLESLAEDDAAVFFGRDAQITGGMDALRAMHDPGSRRFLVIQGASGSGKSSFLRAGLLARLRRDTTHFLPTPLIRPDRLALSGSRGLAAALDIDPAALGGPQSGAAMADAAEALRQRARADCARYLVAGDAPAPDLEPLVVLPVDQGEEIFSADQAEAAAFLEALARGLEADPRLAVALTIRADSVGALQSEPRLADTAFHAFPLKALPAGAFKQVIEGPGAITDPPVRFEPALIDRLLSDIDHDDALPLLALTLEQLTRRRRGAAPVALSDYADGFGGRDGAVRRAVEAAFAAAAEDPALPHDRAALDRLARRAFIPALVEIRETSDQPRRRRARLADLPDQTRRLLEHFVDQRLLVKEGETIEVVHEAVLRAWRGLSAWLGEERGDLQILSALRAAAADWAARAGETDETEWLTLAGERLAQAERVVARPDFAGELGEVERGFLRACRDAERRREAERVRQSARIRRATRIAAIGASAAALLATVLLGFAIGQQRDVARTQSALLARAAVERSEAGRAWSDSQRFGFAAARDSFLSPAAPEARAAMLHILLAEGRHYGLPGDGPEIFYGNSFSDDRPLVSINRDDSVSLWDATSGERIGELGEVQGLSYAVVSSIGTRVMTISEQGEVILWNVATHEPTVLLDGLASGAVFSPDGTRILIWDRNGAAAVWNGLTGERLAPLSLDFSPFSASGSYSVLVSKGATRVVNALAQRAHIGSNIDPSTLTQLFFSKDGTRILSLRARGPAALWNTATGELLKEIGEDERASSAAFSPDGTRFVVRLGSDRTLHDVMTGQEVDRIEDVSMAQFSADGTRLLSIGGDGVAESLDPVTAARLQGPYPLDDVYNVRFSEDLAYMLIEHDDETTRLWDTASVTPMIRLEHSRYPLVARRSVGGFSVTSDGSLMAIAHASSVGIWEIETGTRIRQIPLSPRVPLRVAFSPDGTRIAVSMTGGFAGLWDIESGFPLAQMEQGQGPNMPVFLANGTRLLITDRSNHARLYDFNFPATNNALIAEHCDAELPGEVAELPDPVTGSTLPVSPRHITRQDVAELSFLADRLGEDVCDWSPPWYDRALGVLAAPFGG